MTPGRALLTAAALGLIAGSRSMMAPAVVARQLNRADPSSAHHGRHSQLSAATTGLAVAATTGLAVAEIVADKTPAVGSRLEPAPLIFRAASGAISSAVLASRLGAGRGSSAAIGALSAIAGAYALASARRRITGTYRVPDPVIGALEDGLALGVATFVAVRSHG